MILYYQTLAILSEYLHTQDLYYLRSTKRYFNASVVGSAECIYPIHNFINILTIVYSRILS